MLKASRQDAFQSWQVERKTREPDTANGYVSGTSPASQALVRSNGISAIVRSIMDYSVKLARHPAVEVMAKAFGFWPIDHELPSNAGRTIFLSAGASHCEVAVTSPDGW